MQLNFPEIECENVRERPRLKVPKTSLLFALLSPTLASSR